MRESERLNDISSLDNFKLDAISTIWQFDKAVLAKFENFIRERFKYPKGGGWDLDSLREDILFQNDIEFIDQTMTLLPDEIAKNRRLNWQQAFDTIELIEKELLERYKPNLSSPEDQQTIKDISKVIYAMEAVRLGLFGQQINKDIGPSQINNIF